MYEYLENLNKYSPSMEQLGKFICFCYALKTFEFDIKDQYETIEPNYSETLQPRDSSSEPPEGNLTGILKLSFYMLHK